MEYSYEDFLKQKGAKNSGTKQRSKVGYFKLADDGDEALVRFDYSDVHQFNLVHVHSVKIGDNYRRVSCLRGPYDPLEKCPLCNANEKLFSKVYIKLIEYTKNESGNIVATPKVWERPEAFAMTIASYIQEYGDLRDCVFKIKRIGKKGDLKTEYQVLPTNPMKYSEENGFVKDFTDLDSLDLSHHSYMNKTKEEMETFLRTGDFYQPSTPKTFVVETPTPTQVTNNTFPEPAQSVPQDTPVMSRPRRTYDF